MVYETYKQAVNETKYTQTAYELLELCVICAKDISRNRSRKSIKKFLDTIMTVTLVDVTKYPFELNCCGSCYSSLVQIKLFQKTVVEAGMLIHKKLDHFVKKYKNARPHTAFYFNANQSSLVNNQPIETVVLIQPTEDGSIKFESEDLEEKMHSNQVETILQAYQTNLQSSTTIKIEDEQDASISDNHESPNLPSDSIQSSVELANSEHEEDPLVNFIQNDENFIHQIHDRNENNSPVLTQDLSSNIVQEDGRIKMKCSVCQKLYARGYYKKHLKQHKERGVEIICHQCGRALHSYSALRKHETTHGEKQHMCQVCGHSFYFLTQLKRHVRSHTGEKPFKCTYCSRTFSVRWNLNQHLRLHTNSKPYKCKLC